MSVRLVNVGFGNIVSSGRIVSIISPDSAPAKRMVQEAREKGRLVERENLQRILEVDAVMMDGVTEAEAKAMMSTLCKMRENLAKELKNTHEAD